MKIKSKIKLITILSTPITALSLVSVAASCDKKEVVKPEKPQNPENPSNGTETGSTTNPSTPEQPKNPSTGAENGSTTNPGETQPSQPENPEVTNPVEPENPSTGTETGSTTNSSTPEQPESPSNNGENSNSTTENSTDNKPVEFKKLTRLRIQPLVTYENSNNTEDRMSYRVITYVKEKNESDQYVNNQYLINSVVEKVDFIDSLNEEQRNVYDELVKERQKLISLAYNSPQKVIFQEYNAYQLKQKIINEESFIYPIMISKFIFTIDFVLKNPNYLSKENLYFIVGDRTKTPSQWSQLDSIVVLEDRLYKLLK